MHAFFEHRVVGMVLACGGVDIDVWVFGEGFDEGECVDRFGDHALVEGVEAVDHFVGFFGVEEGAFDVVDIPEECFVPEEFFVFALEIFDGEGCVLWHEHAFVSTDDASCGC